MRVEVALIVDGQTLQSKTEIEKELELIGRLLPNAKSHTTTRGHYKAQVFEVDFYEWYRDLRDAITKRVEVMKFET